MKWPLMVMGVLCVLVGGVYADDMGRRTEDRKTIVLDKGKKITMEFVRIKPGSFTMGSPESEKGRDENEKEHKVTLTKEYWMQTTEVTQGQWEYVMGENPSNFKGDPNLPVENVSWEDFGKFIGKLNEKYKDQLAVSGVEPIKGLKVDLPTEAEWEYACRAGTQTRWPFGEDEEKLGEFAWFVENSEDKTHPVREKKPNGWGLYDMHGNVWEWCKDWYGEYEEGNAIDPQGPDSGEYRMLRGGGSDSSTGVPARPAVTGSRRRSGSATSAAGWCCGSLFGPLAVCGLIL